MKLLKLKINSAFRSLPKGFELNFRQDNFEPEDIHEPICLVGLNGSGKSNSLEVICEIFYYLELQTIAETTELKKLDDRYLKLSFEVEFLISAEKWKYTFSRIIDNKFDINSEDKVTVHCSKVKDQGLQIFIYSSDRRIKYSLKKSNWADILPAKIIGYSSGQNELISNAFIKLDYYYFDVFQKKSLDNNLIGGIDVNRMFFMDYESNELIVLANYLFRIEEESTESEFDKLNKKLKIKDLKSFTINIRFKDYKGSYIEIPSTLNVGIENLKNCASIVYDNEQDLLKEIEEKILEETTKRKVSDINNSAKLRIRNAVLKKRQIQLTYYSDFAVRKGFKHYFKNPYELFKVLYLLRLLNIHCQSFNTRNGIKEAPQGTNLSNLIPKPASEDLVFKIDEIEFIKTNTKESVAYKQLSDGEHQLLHVMGTLNLMSENDVFFILDEPETHFNPEWRAKMVKMIINNSEKDLEQDYFITSHSPFIISDCKPNNVYIFNKTPEGIKVETASQKRLNTFGTSVNILTDEIFNKNESIADYSLFKLNEIKNRKFNSLKAIQKAKEDSRLLGESVEKVLLFRKLITIEEKLKAKTVKKASPVKKSVNKRKTTLSPTTKRAIKPQTAKSTNKKKILTKPATTKNRSKRTKRSSIKKANNRRRSK